MRTGAIESAGIMLLAAIGLGDAWRLSGALRPAGTYHSAMGPDLYLVAVSAALLICGAWHLARTRRQRAATTGTELGEGVGQVGRVALMVVGYVAAFPLLGYLLATVIFFPVAFFLFGVRPLKSILIGLLVAAVFYALFAHLAELPLPKGLLDFGA